MLIEERIRDSAAVRAAPAVDGLWERVRASALAAPTVLLLLTVCMYWKLTLTNQFTWMDHPDAANQVLPWLEFQAREWRHGRVPLWEPFNWGGQPFVGRVEPGAVYPLNWLLFAMPVKDGFLAWGVLHWYFALIHFPAALGCYWLCRDLKRSRAAAVLAGVAFGLGGYVGTVGWPQKVNSSVWTPLAILFFLRGMRGERPLASACLSGGFLGMACLGGHHQIPTLLALTMAGLWAWRLARARRLRTAAEAAAFGLFAFLVGAAQILPAAEFGKLAVRWVGTASPVGWGDRIPYTVHVGLGLTPESLLGLVFPHVDRGNNVFIGLTVLALAGLGAWRRWRVQAVRLVAVVALGGLLFSLSSFVVFHGVLYALAPLVEKARSVAAAIHFFHFGAAVAAAYGLDVFRRRRECALAFTLSRALASLGAMLALVVLVLAAARPQQTDEHHGIAMTALAAFLLAAVLHARGGGRIGGGAAAAALAGLVCIELGNSTGYHFKHREQGWPFLEKLTGYEDVARFIRSRKQPVRVEVDTRELPFNFGERYGIEQFNGHTGLTSNVFRLFADYGRFRELYGVNLSVGREPVREDQVEVYGRPDGIKVFEDLNVMPRTWVVHEAAGLSRDADVAEALRETDFRRQAFLFGEPPELEVCEGDRVDLVRRGSANVVIEADMRCRGMVVLADTYYPGWQATVDGEPAAVHEVYGALRGVVAGPGRHVIHMKYRPETVIAGAVLTVCGFLGMVVLLGRRGTGPAKIR